MAAFRHVSATSPAEQSRFSQARLANTEEAGVNFSLMVKLKPLILRREAQPGI